MTAHTNTYNYETKNLFLHYSSIYGNSNSHCTKVIQRDQLS